MQIHLQFRVAGPGQQPGGVEKSLGHREPRPLHLALDLRPGLLVRAVVGDDKILQPQAAAAPKASQRDTR